jgi:hypothetical protein
MKRICHVALMFLLIATSCSYASAVYASPAKRIIIQFPHELSPTDEIHFRENLDRLVTPDHHYIQQGSRWLLSLPPEIPQEQLTQILADINALKGVSFAEEDKLMKPLLSSPVKHSQ